MTERTILPGVLLLALLLAAGSAQAQINPFRGRGPKLQQDDIALMDKAAQPLMQGGGFTVGDKNSWTNPASGWSGTVTAVGTARRGDLACRVLDYDFKAPGPETERTVRMTWCQTKDGTWKMG